MRDVSKILSDSELLKLRELIRQAPALSVDEHDFAMYPKMMFHPDWVPCNAIIKGHPDPLLRKEALEKLRHVETIVHDIETEEDYIQDGWRSDPNTLIVEANIAAGVMNPDPRVPTGREGRRANTMAAQSRESKLREIRRQYAELTGRKLLDEPEEDVRLLDSDGPEPPAPDAPLPRTKTAKTPHPSLTRSAGRATGAAVSPSASQKRARVAEATARATSATA